MSDDFTRHKLEWIDSVRRNPAVTRFTACVAHELATFLNRKTRDAWPSHEKIAERLNASRSGVKKAVRRLERAGYLDVSRERGRTHTNHYRLRMKKGPSEDRFQRAKRVLPRTEKGPGEDGKRSRLGPQNPSTNPLMNPTDADGAAGSLATALPTGALARPPKSEKTEAKKGLTPAIGFVNGTDHAEVAKGAREKRPADCNRTELEAVHAEKACAEKRGVNAKTVGTCNANR